MRSMLIGIFTAMTIASLCSAQTEQIIWDFNDDNAVVDTNGLAADGVTTDTVVITTNSIQGVTADIANFRAQRTLNDGGAQSLAADSASFSFTINIPSSIQVCLSQIDFVSGNDNNSGSFADNYFKWDLAISTTGSETPGASQATFNQYVNGNRNEVTFDESATFTGLEKLSGVSVTFTLTGYYGSNADYSGGQNSQRWIYLDDVTFTGEVIPPSGSVIIVR